MTAPARQRLTPKKRQQFCEALARCGNITEAARVVGVSRPTLYDYRKADAEFAAEWDRAVELGADALEDEARRRAYDGVDELLTCSRGLIHHDDGSLAMVRKYSDTLLIFLLKGAKPERYRDNVHVSSQSASFGVTVVLERIQNDPRYAERANELVRLLAGTAEADGSSQ